LAEEPDEDGGRVAHGQLAAADAVIVVAALHEGAPAIEVDANLVPRAAAGTPRTYHKNRLTP